MARKRKSGSRCRRVTVAAVQQYMDNAREAIRGMRGAQTCRLAREMSHNVANRVYGAEALLSYLSGKNRAALLDDYLYLISAIPESFDRAHYFCSREEQR